MDYYLFTGMFRFIQNFASRDFPKIYLFVVFLLIDETARFNLLHILSLYMIWSFKFDSIQILFSNLLLNHTAQYEHISFCMSNDLQNQNYSSDFQSFNKNIFVLLYESARFNSSSFYIFYYR